MDTRPSMLDRLWHWLADHDAVAGVIVSLLLVGAIDCTTVTTPPSADSVSYVNVAEQGLGNNPNLAAPFAYRFGTPLLARLLSLATPLSVLASFSLLAFLAAWGTTSVSYLLARSAGASMINALAIAGTVAFSLFNVKFALAAPTMVDAQGLLLITVSVWALVARRYGACLLISCIGLFFKEFLLIPGVLLFAGKITEYWRTRSTSPLLWGIATVCLMAVCFVVPRLAIPVSTGYGANLRWNFSAPSHYGYFENLRYFLSGAPTLNRSVNLGFAFVSYWLPVLLLATPGRMKQVWQGLPPIRALCLLHVLLVLFFALFGGTNIMIFVAYTLPVLVLVLAGLLRARIHWAEVVLMLAVLLAFNRIPEIAGGPGLSTEEIAQFYGGWWTRVDSVTLHRTLEMGGYVLMFILLRIGIGRYGRRNSVIGAAVP